MESRIILVPFPAQGHIAAILQLAHVLHARGFEVTVAAPDFIHRRLVARAASSDDGLSILYASLPSGLPPDDTASDFDAISTAMETRMPAHLERLLLSSDGGPVACVVVDLVASWAIPVAKRCSVPVAGFWPAMLAVYRIVSAIPELIQCGFISEEGLPLRSHDNGEQIAEGLPKLSTEDLPWLVGNAASQKQRFIFWLRVLDRVKSLRWLLVNSFPGEGGDHCDEPPPSPETSELEGGALRILHVGPLAVHEQSRHLNEHPECEARRRASLWEEDRSCLEWLEQQPPNSVVYVSFGSWVAPISPDKINEFAHGLEAAGVPFLWVLKDEKPWRAGLPAGFADRVAGRGGRLVAWAPQDQVLGSPAVGCFLTHCGWNSTLEAVQHEKRLLCWPVSGDQFTNATHIVEVWGAGVRLEGYDRRAVAEGVGRIMRGSEGARVGEGMARLKRRVMGEEGRSIAMANLQCFVEAVRDESMQA